MNSISSKVLYAIVSLSALYAIGCTKSERTDGDKQPINRETITIQIDSYTATTASFNVFADVSQLGDYSEFGFMYSTEEIMDKDNSTFVQVTELDEDNSFSATITNLLFSTKYYYRPYLRKAGVYEYLESKKSFTTANVANTISTIKAKSTHTSIIGTFKTDPKDKGIITGIIWSKSSDFSDSSTQSANFSINDDGSYVYEITSLVPETTYFYKTFVRQGEKNVYSEIDDFTTLNQYAEGLKLVADKSYIVCDGTDKVTFKVYYDGDDITTDATIYSIIDNRTDSITKNCFSSDERGRYCFYALYEHMKSNSTIVNVNSPVAPNPSYDPSPNSFAFKPKIFVNIHTGEKVYEKELLEHLSFVLNRNEVAEPTVISQIFSFSQSHPLYFKIKTEPSVNESPVIIYNMARKSHWNEFSTVLGDLVDTVNESNPPVGISVNSRITDNIVIATVSVKVAKSGVYKAGMWLLEDNLISYQESIIQDNVLRREDSNEDGICGGHTLGYIEEGKTVERVFVIDLKESETAPAIQNLDNIHLNVFVQLEDPRGKKSVVNVIDCPAEGETAFEYL